jgi:hypothetical protein
MALHGRQRRQHGRVLDLRGPLLLDPRAVTDAGGKIVNAPITGLVLLLAMQIPLAPGDGDPGSTPPPQPAGWRARALTPRNFDQGHYASMNVARYRCGMPPQPCTRLDIVHQNKWEPGIYHVSSADGGESFHESLVASGSVGAYASVAADSLGRPVVSYYHPANRLWIARPGRGAEVCGPNSSGWVCQPVGYDGGTLSSITNDLAGHVYAVYRRSTSPSGFYIWDDNPDTSIDRPVASGSAADIAVDEIGRVHLAWISGPCLDYQYWSPSAWSEKETVDCAPSGIPATHPGRVSIKVDRSWHPHIAYTVPLADGGHRVKHAYKTDAYTWVRQYVATAPATAFGQPSLQPGISILLDRDNADTAAISFGLHTSDGSRLMVAFPAHPLLPWRSGVADLRGGAYSSLGWVGHRLAAAHQDQAWTQLRFTKQEP